jgi:SAM-dependent methyltransferase
MTDSTQRFTGHVESYVRYRPSYPLEIVRLLREKCSLTGASVIADVGSGTGILSELFLNNANRVYAVEPNAQMREAAERRFGECPGFTSVAGTAEVTTLGESSVDFVVAGQAFHWFDIEKARAEFGRILRPPGWVILLWNQRRLDATPFLVAYEGLLWRHGTDYERVSDHGRSTAGMVDVFFRADGYESESFDNAQSLDLAGFEGRLLSSSYLPAPNERGSKAMLREAESIFREHQTDGRVTVEYDTRVYYGRLTSRG